VCVFVCARDKSATQTNMSRRDMLTTKELSIELKLPRGTQAGEKEYLFNKFIPPHTQVQSHSV